MYKQKKIHLINILPSHEILNLESSLVIFQ